MAKIEIEVKLNDVDRALLLDVKKGLTGKAGPKPKPEEEPEEEPEDDIGEEEPGEDEGLGEDDTGDAEPTQADVLAALRDYSTVSSKAEAMKLLKAKGGTDALSKLDKAKYSAVIDAANAAAKKAKAKAKK